MFWAITGKHGVYVGTWFRRKDAIVDHCEMLGKCWKTCRRKGDRAVKVKVIPINRRSK